MIDKDYAKFVLAYDCGNIFESMELACDEAYELADEIVDRYYKFMEEEEKGGNYAVYYRYSDYENFRDYYECISFEEVWEQMEQMNKMKYMIDSRLMRNMINGEWID